jgi:hypothetical protein
MMNDRDLLERIDACRADSDDVRDDGLALADELAASPQKRELYEAVQRVDACVVDAMDDVPLPDALQQRLLAALAAAHQRQTDALAAATEPNTTLQPASETGVHPARPAPLRTTRRRLLWGACITAAAGLAAIWPAFRLWQAERSELTPQRLLDETIAFHNQAEPVDLRTLKTALYPPSRLLSSQVHMTGWRPVKHFLDRPGLNGIAFELQLQGVEGTLYVVPTTLPALNSSPLRKPGIMTAGCSVSAWRESGLVYVLVVHGNESAFQRFLNWSGMA